MRSNFDVPMPEDLQGLKVNLLWVAEKSHFHKVGFRAALDDGQIEEQFFPVEGGVDDARAAIEGSVWPAVRALLERPGIQETPQPVDYEPGEDDIRVSVAPADEPKQKGLAVKSGARGRARKPTTAAKAAKAAAAA